MTSTREMLLKTVHQLEHSRTINCSLLQSCFYVFSDSLILSAFCKSVIDTSQYKSLQLYEYDYHSRQCWHTPAWGKQLQLLCCKHKEHWFKNRKYDLLLYLRKLNLLSKMTPKPLQSFAAPKIKPKRFHSFPSSLTFTNTFPWNTMTHKRYILSSFCE